MCAMDDETCEQEAYDPVHVKPPSRHWTSQAARSDISIICPNAPRSTAAKGQPTPLHVRCYRPAEELRPYISAYSFTDVVGEVASSLLQPGWANFRVVARRMLTGGSLFTRLDG
jgi:hypothetical protein